MEYPAALAWVSRQGRRLIIVWQYVYETRLAPYLATYVWVVWWPLKAWAERNQVCFVWNIAEGTGQVLPELDNFWLARHLREVDPHKKYVWLRTRNDFSAALVPLYKKHFWRAIESNLVYDLCLPALLRWREIAHDAGMAGLHWQLPTAGPLQVAPPWSTYLYVRPKSEPLTRWRQYYRRRAQAGAFAPLREAKLTPDKALRDFLGEAGQPLVLVHLKTNIMNATARPTDPATYLPTLRFLTAQGYRLIFVGREKMPEEFTKLGLLNYAQAPVASFRHDLQLFALARFSITGGSGIAWIADCLRQPIVYLNSWHVFMPPAGSECVFVPTLVRHRKAERLLTYREQQALYLTAATGDGDVFPGEAYQAVNASAEDILAATQELVTLLTSRPSLTAQQKAFRSLGAASWLAYSAARVSAAFVERHPDLLK